MKAWPPPSNNSDASAPESPTPVTDPAFEDFFRANVTRMVRLGGLITGSQAVGEEIAQEAFSSVYARWSTLQEPAGYLRTIVVNRSRSHLRHEDVARRGDAKVGVKPDRVEDNYPNADRSVLDALDRLNERQRAAVVLKFWSDLPEKEIATILDCRPGTVKSMLSRALDDLRK